MHSFWHVGCMVLKQCSNRQLTITHTIMIVMGQYYQQLLWPSLAWSTPLFLAGGMHGPKTMQ